MDRKEIGVDSVTGREGNKFKEKYKKKLFLEQKYIKKFIL